MIFAIIVAAVASPCSFDEAGYVNADAEYAADAGDEGPGR